MYLFMYVQDRLGRLIVIAARRGLCRCIPLAFQSTPPNSVPPTQQQSNFSSVQGTSEIDAYYVTFAHLPLGTARLFTRRGSVSSRGRVWRIPPTPLPYQTNVISVQGTCTLPDIFPSFVRRN